MVYASNRNRRSCCYVPIRESKPGIWAWFDSHPFVTLCAECAIIACMVWLFFAVYFLA